VLVVLHSRFGQLQLYELALVAVLFSFVYHFILSLADFQEGPNLDLPPSVCRPWVIEKLSQVKLQTMILQNPPDKTLLVSVWSRLGLT